MKNDATQFNTLTQESSDCTLGVTHCWNFKESVLSIAPMTCGAEVMMCILFSEKYLLCNVFHKNLSYLTIIKTKENKLTDIPIVFMEETLAIK